MNEIVASEFPPTKAPFPRPQLERGAWINLNGEWDFAFDPKGNLTEPGDIEWDRMIL